ncbi:hypothetical protein QYE76_001247 [Lolium multiflorum]|uniref:Uncharacterized protein n=1 Tax=Lolium multiflorum TaxID=4521 RepID=A0AAD8RLP4_LOLMU|nr:hypothetical protein QYE76_001247 [Lolium multiflorum]
MPAGRPRPAASLASIAAASSASPAPAPQPLMASTSAAVAVGSSAAAGTFCTRWPTLLEALTTRSPDQTPHMSITTVVPTAGQSDAAQLRSASKRTHC